MGFWQWAFGRGLLDMVSFWLWAFGFGGLLVVGFWWWAFGGGHIFGGQIALLHYYYYYYFQVSIYVEVTASAIDDVKGGEEDLNFLSFILTNY